MQNFLRLTAAAFVCMIATTAAFAHAFLDRAVPGVGATVTGSPGELVLSFTQNVVIAFSGVTLSNEGGGAIPVAKPTLDPANPNTIHVHLNRALGPGTYLVSWHVVSVDTHPTSGTYKFTVTQ